MRTAWMIVALPLAAACGEPLHLGYDFGRSYTQAVTSQADLTRPAAAALEMPLEGVEAQAIRLQAIESSSDEESGEAEATKQ